jgi:hypothetical protein
MSERNKYIKEYGQLATEVGVAGLALGLLGVSFITGWHHRRYTHESIDLHPALSAVGEFEQITLGVDPVIWASVHTTHHAIPDASLKGFHDFYLGAQWIEENAEKVPGVMIPETIPNLDPFAPEIKYQDAMKIGGMAVDYMKQRVGEKFKPPETYTAEELSAILNPPKPTYFYPAKKHKGPFNYDEMADRLLRDPHSPVLVAPPETNGVQGVAKHNVDLYSTTADLFRAHPDLIPTHLQRPDGSIKRGNKWHVAAGFAIPAAAVLLRRGKYGPQDFAIAALSGAAINGIRTGFEVMGGNITNSLGHAGTLTQKEMLRAISEGVYKPKLNPDGTVTTNTEDAGFVGRLVSKLTLDEVGGQQVHHANPEKIAYTYKEGLDAWIEAPWGKLLEAAAHSKYFPLIKPGRGFGLKPGERRPDMPLPAMELLHKIRVEQLKQIA